MKEQAQIRQAAFRADVRGRSRQAWGFVRRHPPTAVGAVVVALLVFVGLATPLIEPRDPLKTEVTNRLSAPTSANPLGTDFLGRDILSRIMRGTRISLFVAFVSVLLGTTAGSVWGVATGYIGGKFDLFSQRVVEVFQSFPPVLLALVFATAFGAGLWTVIAVIAATRISYGTRIIRAQAMGVKEMPYVEAARAIGARPLRIMARHIAPQCFASFIVLLTVYLGIAIAMEALLGFLGIGVPPPTPTWGNMLGEASSRLQPPWFLVFFPGMAITLAILGLNLVGDGVRDALDPRLRGAAT